MAFRTRLVVVALFTVLAAQAAEARRLRVQIPIPVRITAYVNEKLEGIKPDFEWVVADKQTQYTLYVLNLIVKSGQATPLDIDAAVAPYRIKFQLAGEAAALRVLTTAPPRQQIVFEGYIRFVGGSRFLMLDTAEPAPAPTPASTGAPGAPHRDSTLHPMPP